MTSWLNHAALCYAVEQSLTSQTSGNPGVTVSAATTSVEEASSSRADRVKKWVISKNDHSVGILAVESGVLRWYGPVFIGITGQELGRAQLESFIQKINSSAH